MDYNALAELLFPDVTLTPDELELRYPPRKLPEGAKVTRMAPSPTGEMHLGNLYGALIDKWLARQSGGVFFLRLEDTDAKREVENGTEKILSTFELYGLNPDEGASLDGDIGDYGPYRQRRRAEIYHCYVKQLVRKGRAYPCFCSEQDLAEMRREQEAIKATPGYYGEWASHRDCSFEEVKSALAEGKSYVVRFRSEGDPEKYQKMTDCIKGTLEFPQNFQDVILLKSDGIPTYHFAHVVDDHLMRTTHVVRGEDWLATLPIHLELFAAMDWKTPKYSHPANIMKMDGDSRRKLSKRKDAECALSYYRSEGYPVPAVLEYLMTLINSNFEEWRIANKDALLEDFQVTFGKMSVSGPLFDLAKLQDVSKNIIALMSAEEVYSLLTGWALEFDPEWHALLTRDPEYAKRAIAVGRGGAKPRKDIALWREAKEYFSFYFDELFRPEYTFPEAMTCDDVKTVLARYQELYDPSVEQGEWFDSVKKLAAEIGYAPEMKEYKKNPDGYRGHVGDISMTLRAAVCGRPNSPDLHQVMSILGRQRVCERLRQARDAAGE